MRWKGDTRGGFILSVLFYYIEVAKWNKGRTRRCVDDRFSEVMDELSDGRFSTGF